MIESSSVLPQKFLCGHLRKSSAIFGNFRKMFGNDRLAFGKLLENLRKSSEFDIWFQVEHSKKNSISTRTHVIPLASPSASTIQRFNIRVRFTPTCNSCLLLQSTFFLWIWLKFHRQIEQFCPMLFPSDSKQYRPELVLFFCACPSKNVIKHDVSEQKGTLSRCKYLFQEIGANWLTYRLKMRFCQVSMG